MDINVIEVEKYARRRAILVVLCLILVWNAAAWFIADHFFRSRVDDLIEQETFHSQQRADDLADSIQRNLNYLHGIPDLLSELLRVKNAVTHFGAGAVPSKLSLEQRRKRWTADPGLNDLSRYLVLAKKSLNADLIYVVNQAGDCIAASNWDTPGTSIGTNFAERDFFAMNKNGQRGIQYAVGKTTHIPGLYFSSPVVIDGKFMGAVVAKADVPNLSFLTRQLEALVVDANGVIILARDINFEMRAMPGAAIFNKPEQEKLQRYLRSDFPVLRIEPWGEAMFPTLLVIEDEYFPHIKTQADLPQFNLKVYVIDEIPAVLSMIHDRFWFTILLGALGSALIMVVSGALFYFQSVGRSRELLWKQANFDALTGLPNRAMFHDRLEQELKKAGRSGQPLALMLVDLDRFKEVNDTLGHAMGDLLLQEVARRMVVCVRESDTVARLGGDEFTVVLSQLADAKHAEDIARKIIATLAAPFQLHDHTAYVSASVGVALYPQDAADIDSLIRNADQA
ncbi:MAG: diguanylate cyclase, partial [Nitrosomonadales bacterium]|nr:diguanylate cyclase [Nitrosomonadales bacterium]